MIAQILAALSLLFISVASYEASFSLDVAQRFVKLAGASYCSKWCIFICMLTSDCFKNSFSFTNSSLLNLAADPLIGKDSINNWSCQACKNFPSMNATTFHGKFSDANGFVGYDSQANQIVVAFAGTDPLSIQNWIDDLNYFQTDYPYCSGCRVHEGFYNSFLSVAGPIKSMVASLINSHPSAEITVTGHSLGAALAAHCVAELTHNTGLKVSASYTYGMPRVGNEAFETWYKNRVAGTYRVVHNHDPVPHVPFENMGGGFHHMPYEVFYTTDYKKWKLCNFEGEDKSCSNQFVADLDVCKYFPLRFDLALVSLISILFVFGQ